MQNKITLLLICLLLSCFAVLNAQTIEDRVNGILNQPAGNNEKGIALGKVLDDLYNNTSYTDSARKQEFVKCFQYLYSNNFEVLFLSLMENGCQDKTFSYVSKEIFPTLTKEQNARFKERSNAYINEHKKTNTASVNNTAATPQLSNNILKIADNLNAVKENGKWGVQKDGQYLVYPVYDTIGPYIDGMAAVMKNGYCGFINMQGVETIRPQYKGVLYFSEGFAAVSDVILGKVKWYYVYRDGSRLNNELYDAAGSFKDGKAYVTKDGKSYYINTLGKTIQYAAASNVCPVCHGSGVISHKYEGAIYDYSITWSKQCGRCNGTGKIN